MNTEEMLEQMVALKLRGRDDDAAALLIGAPGTESEHLAMVIGAAPAVFGRCVSEGRFDEAAIVATFAMNSRDLLAEADA